MQIPILDFPIIGAAFGFLSIAMNSSPGECTVSSG